MKKVKKVTKVKSKIKVIKEIRKSEGDKEIGDLTSQEVGFSDQDMGQVTDPVVTSVGAPVRTADLSPTLEGSAGSVVVPEEELDTGPLYDIGKTLGGQTSGDEYKPVDNVATQNLRGASVGRDFVGAQAGDNPEAQALQGKIRQDSDKAPYDGDRMDAERGGGAKRKYPWEL